jgi:hypothetical protein
LEAILEDFQTWKSFLICWRIRNSRVSASELKKLYCTPKNTEVLLVASKDVNLDKMQWQPSICSCLVTRMQDEIKTNCQHII